MKRLTALMIAFVLVLGTGILGLAAAPQREEQFVYGISAWDGKEFQSTFVPKAIGTIYLLADEDHIVSGAKTDVYFWDITQEWMGNWMEKRIEVEGKLEILSADGKVVKTLERIPYVYRFESGSYTPSIMLKGEEAQKAYKQYKAELDAYYDAMDRYRDARIEYEKTLNEMVKRVQETGEAYDESEIPKPPEEPKPPSGFVTKPVEAFIVNLPVGDYRIRMIGDDGVIPDTEKKLHVFAARRYGVGYEILPESKWTRPVMSDDRAEILYLHGKRTVYLKAFNEAEYSAYAFQRMTQAHKPLAGAGLQGAWQWRHGQELEDVKVEILQDGKVVQTVEQAPYYVQQTPGYALGYDIVEFDPSNEEMKNRRPSFSAFKLVLEPGSYVLRVVDEKGKVVPGSVREIRTVKQQSAGVLYGLSALPLLIGLVLIGFRRLSSVSRGKSQMV